MMKHYVVLSAFVFALITTTANAFVIYRPSNNNAVCNNSGNCRSTSKSSSRHWISSQEQQEEDNNNPFDDDDDASLLKSVKRSQFVSLCKQYNLSTVGGKEKMLERLRDYSSQRASEEEQRIKERTGRIEQGFFDEESTKERYEIVGDDFLEEDKDKYENDDSGYFYFSVPKTEAQLKVEKEEEKKKKRQRRNNNSNRMTEPPPPLGLEPNEDGERVMVTYNSQAPNDLTPMYASMPNQQDNDPLSAGSASSSQTTRDLISSNDKGTKLPIELDKAKEIVDELVRSLLLLSGAPGFQEDFMDGVQPLNMVSPDMNLQKKVFQQKQKQEGFDPRHVDTEVLISSSKALRAGRGSVLDEILRDYEIKAIGHDGMHKTAGEVSDRHYRQVSKVRAFLEGFRRAETKRVNRETITMLLDKIATEGIQGLDRTLTTMTKISDDSGDPGELSDGTLLFLNDLVREQERKTGESSKIMRTPSPSLQEDDDELLNNLWNVTTNEDGERIETLDPKDPKVQNVLMKVNSRVTQIPKEPPLPIGASERLLLMLKILRDRIKVEAAFGGADNEHGRNLRALAYCLKFQSPQDRDKYIRLEYGSSVDRLDSFLDLVSSSIEYAETTTAQLTPSKVQLNIPLLQDILTNARDIRDEYTILKP